MAWHCHAIISRFKCLGDESQALPWWQWLSSPTFSKTPTLGRSWAPSITYTRSPTHTVSSTPISFPFPNCIGDVNEIKIMKKYMKIKISTSSILYPIHAYTPPTLAPNTLIYLEAATLPIPVIFFKFRLQHLLLPPPKKKPEIMSVKIIIFRKKELYRWRHWNKNHENVFENKHFCRKSNPSDTL